MKHFRISPNKFWNRTWGSHSTHFKKKFEELGLNVTEDHASEKSWLGANNLICTLPATSAKEDVSKIYFTSHMDTVVPGINIKPQIKEDGYIYSDGSTILGADDKAD